MMFSLAPAKHRPRSWTTLRIQIQNSGPPRSIATSLLRHCRQSACVSAHAVAMPSSHSVVSAEVDHPGATVWCCLPAYKKRFVKKFFSFIPSNHIFELLSFRFENAQAWNGRARLLLFHLCIGTICSWRILVVGWPEEKDSQVSQQASSKRIQQRRK